MKTCKYCKSEIDKKAKICPNCRKKQGSSIIGIVIIFFLILVIVSAVASNEGSNKDDEKFSHVVEKSYLDDIGMAYYIEGTVTNNKDKDYSYVQIEFVCYDEEGNNLGTAIDNTNNLLKKETWKFKAMGMFTNQKVDHCDFKEVSGW